MKSEACVKEIIDIERIVQNLNKENRFSEKIPYCMRGLELAPDNNYFLSNLAFYYYRTMADYENAYTYLRKCLENGDTLPAVKNAYFNSLIKTNRIPDVFDVKLLKSEFDKNGKFNDSQLILVNRIIDNYEEIDPDVIMFYMVDKLRKKDYENIVDDCDLFIDRITNNTKGLRAIEYMIIAMRQINNLNKYKEYVEIYTNMVYEYPDRLTENRLNNIKQYHLYLEKKNSIHIY